MNKDWVGTPSLTGTRVELAPLCPDDAQALAAAMDEPKAFAWTSVPHGVDEARAYIDLALNTSDRQAFSVTDLRTGNLVGTTSYYEISPSDRALAIGATWYSSVNHGDGTNPDAKYLLLRYAFETLGAVRVVFHTDERNAQSRAAIHKLGATFEGLLRKQRQRPDGTWRTTAQYSLIDDDWPATADRLLARIRP